MSGPPANSTDRAGRAAPLPGALACALRRALLTLLVVLTVAAGVQMMFHILVPNGLKPLEVGILGLSRADKKPVWNGEAFEPRLMLPLSLSYDHRVIDGAEGVRFLNALREALDTVREELQA